MLRKKKLLYVGLNPSNYQTEDILIHLPLIRIVPYPLEELKNIMKNFPFFTHVLITSKSTIPILVSYLQILGFSLNDWTNKKIITVGKATSRELGKYGLQPHLIAKNETSEGLTQELDQLDLKNAHLFWPHSALSRSVIKDYILAKQIKFTDCHLYDTLPIKIEIIPNLNDIDTIIFSSPSTVDAFIFNFGHLPNDKKLISIGPITEMYLDFLLKS